MKLLNVLFTFQCIILICEITNVLGQRSLYDRDGQQFGAERYRRQKKSQRLPSQAQYYATPNLINPDDPHPNSYYNRMPSNKNLAPDGVNSKRILIDPTESSKIFHHHHSHHGHHGHGHGHHNHLKRRRRPQQSNYAAQTSPCYYRNARTVGRPNQSQGRFFWDLNLYNIIPGAQAQYSDNDCDDYNGGSSYNDYGGSYSGSNNGGLLNNYLLNLAGYGARPQNRPSPYRPLSSGGLIPNSIPNSPDSSGNVSPTGGSSGGSQINQNPDIYDPVYDERPVYENQFASQPQVIMGPNLSPGQIVGGIAQTVNGVIQTLSGNTQQGQFLRTLYNRNRIRRYRN